MFQPAAKAGFGAALNGQAVQLAQFVRRHPFGRDAPAVFPHRTAYYSSALTILALQYGQYLYLWLKTES